MSVVSGLKWRLTQHARRSWRRLSHRSDAERAGRALEQLVVERAGQPGWDASFVVQSLDWTETGTVVARLGLAGLPPVLIARLPRSVGALRSARAHWRTIEAIQSDDRLESWRALVPRPVWAGRAGESHCLVETALPGIEAGELLDEESRPRLLRAAGKAIGELHQRTAESVEVGADAVEEWVNARARLVGGQVDAPERARRLADDLGRELSGRRLDVGWVHGDYWGGNVLVAPDASAVTGIVDWAQAARAEPVALDTLLLVLASRIQLERQELGAIVVRLLERPDWSPLECELFGAPPDRAMLLLCWLRHVHWQLAEATLPSQSNRWIAANVARVLETCR